MDSLCICSCIKNRTVKFQDRKDPQPNVMFLQMLQFNNNVRLKGFIIFYLKKGSVYILAKYTANTSKLAIQPIAWHLSHKGNLSNIEPPLQLAQSDDLLEF